MSENNNKRGAASKPGAGKESSKTQVQRPKSRNAPRSTGPSGPSLARFTDRMSHATPWLFAILTAVIGISSVVLFSGAGSISGPGGQSAPENINVVVVNGQPITRTDVENAVENMKQEREMFGGGSNVTISQLPQLYADTVKQLVQEKVELDSAQHSGIRVSDSEYQTKLNELVDQEYTQMQSGFQSPQIFQTYLKNQGKTAEDEKADIRDELQENADNRGVNLKQALSDEALVADFKKQQEQQVTFPLQVHYSQIVLNFTPKSQSAIQAKAQAIVQKLKSGGDFAKMAQQDSNDTYTKSKGGDAGWAAASGTGVPPYLAGADKAPIGAILGPTKAYNSWYIVKITAKATKLPATFNATTDTGLQSAADQAYQTYLDGLVKKAKVQYKDMALAGAAAQAANDNKAAMADYLQAMNPKSSLPASERSWVSYALGQMYMTQNNPKMALTYFNDATTSDSTSADAWLAAGDAASKLNQKADALADYKKALQWGSSNMMALFQLQQDFKKMGDSTDAAAAGKKFQTAVASQRNSGGMMGGMGGPGGMMGGMGGPGGMMGGPGGPGGPMGGPGGAPITVNMGGGNGAIPINVKPAPVGVGGATPIRISTPAGKGKAPIVIPAPRAGAHTAAANKSLPPGPPSQPISVSLPGEAPHKAGPMATP